MQNKIVVPCRGSGGRSSAVTAHCILDKEPLILYKTYEQVFNCLFFFIHTGVENGTGTGIAGNV